MKKIFTLIAFALLTGGGNAQTRETLWEGAQEMGSSWPSVQLAKSNFASASVGDKIIVTISKASNAINSGWEWGPQVFVNVDWKGLSDTSSKSFSESDEPQDATFEISEAGLEQILAGSEVEIQGMNVVVSKVELESAVKTASSALWEGECSFGDWANGFSIDATKFTSVNAGDVVEFVYTTDDANPNTWWQFKTIFAGTEEALTSNKADLNDWDCATVAKGSTSYKIALNADDVAKLKESGMYVSGYYNIVTKVNLIQAVADVTIVGPEDNSAGWWAEFSEYYQIPANKTLHLEFVNYSNKVNNWNNWLFVAANNERGGEGYYEYFVLRADNYGWGDGKNTFAGEGAAEYWEGNGVVTSDYNWDTFRDDLDGASVVLEATNDAANNKITVVAKTTTADGSKTYTETFIKNQASYAVAVADPITAFLLVEGAHIVIDNTKTAILDNGTLTGIKAISNVKAANAAAVRYNLAGQQVDASFKGVVIENGKKLIQK